uniref:Centrosomal protein 131 n=1 Tax=Falco tinnunculus TaxID=100819 RepID=A0A8C4U0I5_FALTI
MKSARSSSSFQGAGSGSVDLSLTGLPVPVLRRPSSASPAKHMVRSVSVTTDGKPKRNTLGDAGSRAMNNLRRSNSTTQVNQRTGDFLTFFESGSGGRKKLASLSKTSPEKKTTWNILDDQPRAFPGFRSGEPPAGMRRKEATVLLAANFTANNRSNKGAMGNCVTTMVHNNYSTTEKGPAPKSSNQAPSSLNNVVKATSNEDGESSSFVKSQKNFSSNNIMTHNNNSSLPQRKEVTEEEWEGWIPVMEKSQHRFSQAFPRCSFTALSAQQEPSSNSLTTDNLEKFGKLNHSPGVPEDGALLSEAKLQSIISFLDEMEKSEQERPRPCWEGSPFSLSCSIVRLKLEVKEKQQAIGLLQTALAQQRELTDRHVKQTEKELGHQLRLQREQYEAAIQRHLAFIDQLIDDKKVLSEKCEAVVAELKQVDQKYGKKVTQMQEQHELEIKKLKELMSAAEKIRREKWIDEKTKKIKEITVKGLEPEIQKLIAKHRQDIRKLKTLHEAELLQSDERAAQRYSQQAEELRGLLEREKEEQSQRERERARQRCEQQLEQEEQALQQQRHRLYAEVAEEKERLSQQAARQRAEAEELRQQLEASSKAITRALKEEYAKEKEEQERRHQAEVKVLKDQLEIEKQAWEANYIKKEEAWLLSRERELREEVRKERDKEIELVIQRLEADMSSAKEECERAAENRIKRIRDKYEVELQELERSERKLQERCNELKGRLAELEGESIRLQGLLKHKEQEVEEIQKVRDQLAQERSSLAEVIRQEFVDRLVGTEEENKRLKAEMAEMRARQRLELDRVVVKTAVVRKEESVSSLRKQYEAAVQRANRLEALLEQQRKQLLATK